MSGFTMITEEGDFITSPMPADETIVEVVLKDGTTHRALFSKNLMEAGDWDFSPVDQDDEATDENFPSEVVGWRPA